MSNEVALKSGLKFSLTDALFNEIRSNTNGYYYFIGKPLKWNVDDAPDVPDESYVYEINTRNEIIFAKRILASDLAFVIPRHDWVPGTIYDMYDDRIGVDNPAHSGATTLRESNFYVMTNEYNVYKCLFNGYDAPSTIKPFSTSHKLIKTSDGYVWKYMYTIPSALVNRFVTLFDIPVTTSISNQFYSRGAINSILVVNPGKNYMAGSTSLEVFGNGNQENNPLAITSATVELAGAGYSGTPILNFADPFSSSNFISNATYLLGQYVKSNNRIYRVVTPGTIGTVPPSHTDKVARFNGTVSLQFVGRTITGTATMSGGSVSSITLNGFVTRVKVLNPGFGYSTTALPTISVIGSGTGAVVSPSIVDSRIVRLDVVSQGDNYQAAELSIEPPMDYDAEWEAGASVSINDILIREGRYYQVVSGNTLGTVFPTHTKGSAASGNTVLEYVGEQATALVEVSFGYGYAFTPSCVLTGPTGSVPAQIAVQTEKTKAQIVPIIENGQITNVIIEDPGVGYTAATIAVVGDGVEANIQPFFSVGDLNTRQANVELLATPGTIDAIKITNPGSNYSVVAIEVVGDGTGCTAEAILTNGTVTAINVLTPGSNYTRATAIITGDGLVQATARPIISPVEGHGKNAIAELGASDLILSTSFSSDRNQGFEVRNDYRQVGIIKNPKQFRRADRLTSQTVSACFAVSANFVFNTLEPDQILTDDDGNRYLIVSKQVNALLLQELDGVPPTVGRFLYYQFEGLARELVITAVSLPTIDKYSGEMLYIDNRAAFTPTVDQTISVKTAIRL